MTFFKIFKCAKVSKSVRKFLSIIWLWSERHNMVQMDRCKLTLDLPKFQPMKEQDSHLLTNQRPSLTLDLPKVVIAPPSDNGLVLRRQKWLISKKPLTNSCLNWTGGPCDYSVSPSPLDLGLGYLGLWLDNSPYFWPNYERFRN